MKKISNDDNFQNFLNRYINVEVDGTIKKFFISEINSASSVTNAGILYKPYNILNESTLQYCYQTLSTYAFFICNSNAVADDDFEIYLNGVSVGSAILGQDDYIGSILFASPSSQNTISFVETPFICPLNTMTSYYFNSAIFETGTNTLSMINRVEHNSNNYGSIALSIFELSIFEICSGSIQTSVTNSETVEIFNYSGSTGEDFSFTFTL
jgi:hypothetical protein